MIIPKTNSLMVPIPKAPNFHIPEGKYLAKITSVKKEFVEKLNCTGEVLKLLFEVQVPSLLKKLNIARAEFRLDMTPGSELHNLCYRFFGKHAMTEAAESETGTFNLKQLDGLDVEIEIEHIITNRRDDYAYPLVKVRDIRKLEVQLTNKEAKS